MPNGASFAKASACRGYGVEVILEGRTFEESLRFARRQAPSRGMTLIHAFDDPDIIAGQGTIGLEIVNELPDVDLVMVPTGGGGLLSGVALAVKSQAPHARVVGVQAAAASAWANAG